MYPEGLLRLKKARNTLQIASKNHQIWVPEPFQAFFFVPKCKVTVHNSQFTSRKLHHWMLSELCKNLHSQFAACSRQHSIPSHFRFIEGASYISDSQCTRDFRLFNVYRLQLVVLTYNPFFGILRLHSAAHSHVATCTLLAMNCSLHDLPIALVNSALGRPETTESYIHRKASSH